MKLERLDLLRRIGRRSLLGLCLVAFAAAPAHAAATTYTVTATSDRDGVCFATNCPSLRAAVAAANTNPGSTVSLPAGTFTLGNGPGAPVGAGELQISAPTTITGAGAGSTVIEQTDGQDRVLDIWYGGAPVTINDLTITGGRLNAGASEPGAAIFTVPPLTLNRVVITGNRETGSTTLDTTGCCQAVGAITSLSFLTINHSSITDNHATADAGGNTAVGGQAVAAILATQISQITIADSTISGNTATSGSGGSSLSGAGGDGGNAYGALFVEDSAPLTITGSRFSDNAATAGAGGTGTTGGKGGSAYGGGVVDPDGILHVTSSTFDGNVASAGAGGIGTSAGGDGGLAMGGGLGGGSRETDNSILNSTFTANVVKGGAGGLGLTLGTSGIAAGGGLAEDMTHSLTLVSSTFDSNVAGGPGQSWGGNIYDAPTILTLAENIFSGGVAKYDNNCAITATEIDHGYNLETSANQCGLSSANHDLISADPRLLPLAARGGSAPVLSLGSGSAALAAGGTCLDYTQPGAPPLSADERGVGRPVPCDIGAFQTAQSSPSGSGSSASSSGTSNPGYVPPSHLPPKATPLRISGVAQTSTRWRSGKRNATTRRARQPGPPVGTAFRFSLSDPAAVILRFITLVHGHRTQRRCVSGRPSVTSPGCQLKLAAGQLSISGAHAGRNIVRFKGRLPGGRRLAPGRYSVTVEATRAGRRVSSNPLRFTVVS